MQEVAVFEKISFKEFEKAWRQVCLMDDEELKSLYEAVKLPCRATKGSAGYDFFTPVGISLKPKESFLLPTGVRVKIDDGWFLAIMPKSGLGFKFRLQMDNTIGVIDSDYYYSDNEGHIFVRMTNDTNQDKVLELNPGAAVCQGILLPYGLAYGDDVSAKRNGGFGSTAK